jgi:hypothetical protein
MSDDIDRSNWTEQDHLAEQIGRDLTEIATDHTAEPDAEPVSETTFIGFLRLLGVWFAHHAIATGIAAVFLVLLIAVAVGFIGKSSGGDNPATAATTASSSSGDAAGTTSAQTASAGQGGGTAVGTGQFGTTQIDITFGSFDEAFQQYGVTSYLTYTGKPAKEGDLPPLMSPDLVGGEVHVTLDFDAMTARGTFDLQYECDGRTRDHPVCDAPDEGFAGSATGSFSDLPIIPAPTGDTPPDFWDLPAEDWYPPGANSWYIYGPVPVDIQLAGTISMASIRNGDQIQYLYDSVDDQTSATAAYHADLPVNGAAVGGGLYNLYIELPQGDGTWQWNLSLTQQLDQPLPDPRQ